MLPEVPDYARDAILHNDVTLIPLFHTGHESPESPRIDFLLIRGNS